MPENVVDVTGASSVRGEQHRSIVSCPIEGKVIGIVKRQAVGRTESRPIGEELCQVNIQLRFEPAIHQVLTISGDAGLIYEVVTGCDSGRNPAEMAGTRVHAYNPEIRGVPGRWRFVHRVKQPPIRQPFETEIQPWL